MHIQILDTEREERKKGGKIGERQRQRQRDRDRDRGRRMTLGSLKILWEVERPTQAK